MQCAFQSYNSWKEGAVILQSRDVNLQDLLDPTASVQCMKGSDDKEAMQVQYCTDLDG